MKKLHVLSRVSYGDFDISQSQPIAVSANKAALDMMAAEKNTKLTKEERAAETSYQVAGQVEYLDDHGGR